MIDNIYEVEIDFCHTIGTEPNINGVYIELKSYINLINSVEVKEMIDQHRLYLVDNNILSNYKLSNHICYPDSKDIVGYITSISIDHVNAVILNHEYLDIIKHGDVYAGPNIIGNRLPDRSNWYYADKIVYVSLLDKLTIDSIISNKK